MSLKRGTVIRITKKFDDKGEPDMVGVVLGFPRQFNMEKYEFLARFYGRADLHSHKRDEFPTHENNHYFVKKGTYETVTPRNNKEC